VVRHALRLAAWLLCTLLSVGCGGERPAPAIAQVDDAEFEQLRARAVALHERGDDPAASRAALEAALALRPGHFGLNQRLARLCLDLRLHEPALQALERAHETRPEDPRILLTIISLQIRLGRFDEALARVPGVVDDPELRGEALYQQALALEQLGERDAARTAARQTDSLPPERGYRAQAMLGRMALEDGDFQTARGFFERARVGRPDSREALKGLADSARRLGLEQEADRWDGLLDMFVALNDSAFARTPEQASARRARLEALIDVYPEWSAGYEELAELQRAQGDAAAACGTIEAWLAVHGTGMPAAAAAKLRQRYCTETP
jgi:tetratricopeptide (TPR) repeat protein